MKNFTAVKVSIDPWHERPAVVHVPTDSPLDNGLFPAMVFFHGVGEEGNAVEALLNVGLPYVVENSGSVYGTDPGGKVRKFIVFALQAEYWSPDPKWMQVVIAWLIKNYKVDPGYITATGLSAGGQNSFNCLAEKTCSALFANGVCMSLPGGLGGDKDPSLIATNKIETWFFTGDQDTVAAPSVTKDANTLCNKVYPSSSRITVFPWGHGGWSTFYDPKWKDGVSIYDFALANSKASPSVPINPTTNPPEKKLVMTIKVYDDNTTEVIK
jgi:predicted peptidase